MDLKARSFEYLLNVENWWQQRITKCNFLDRCPSIKSGIWTNCRRKKARYIVAGFLVFGAWKWPTLTWGDPTLPSAILRFTSEFGMDSGGATTLWFPDKFGNLESCYSLSQVIEIKFWVHTTLSVTLFRVSSNFVFRNISFSYKTHQGCMVKPHESLVQVSSTPHNAYTPCLSTS